ncbi:MAG TPA: hypothetical protein VJ964_12175 [Balneolaceae bacterium]|nr:hypothetical protein [Balneolaceae bacterium]
MNKPTKIFLGVLTFLPLIVGIAAVGYVIYQFVSIMATQNPYMPMMLFAYMGYIIPFLFLFGLFDLALIIFYLVHIGRNNILDSEKKFLWMVVVITLNGIAMPIYWYVHVWNSKSELNPAAERSYESSGTESPEF